MMIDKSGVKMPRGNKVNNLKYSIPNITIQEQKKILSNIEYMEHEIGKAKEIMASAKIKKIELLYRYVLGQR